MLKTQGDGSSQGLHPISTNSNHPSLDTLLAALPCPVYYSNSAGICLGCNQAFQDQVIGEFDLQIIGQSLADIERLLPTDMFQIFAESDAPLLKKSGRRLFEAKIRCGDGKTRLFAIHQSTICDQHNKISGMVAIMLDITANRDTEAEFKTYSDELEKEVAKRAMSITAANRRLSDEIDRRRKAEKAFQNSEDRYRSIFENTGTATILIEPDMTISMANAKAEKMAGLPRDQFVGRSNALDFVTPKHRDRIMLYHELRLKGDPNAPQQFEFQISDKDGATRDILANVQLVPETQQTVASLLDITEKNQLQKERQRLAAVIDQSAEAVIMTDKHGRVEYINQAFEKLSGFDRDDCVGQTLEADFFSKEDRQILKQMTFMVSGKDSWSGRVKTQRRDRRTYIADTRIFPICDDRGSVINLVCVKTDVTHEVQLEKQLQHAQKMEAIGTLAGGIAHDFNNILGGILGYAEISIGKVGGNDQLKRNIDRILDGCHRAKELVQNILAFSRKNDEEIKPIEIHIIVKEARNS
jgi:PAS domain S-box-containing protein